MEYDPAQCSPAALREAVRQAGYDLIVGAGDAAREAEKAAGERYRSLKRRTVWAIALSVPVVVVGMFWMGMPYAEEFMWLLSTPVVFVLGRDFFVNAWRQLRRGSANMDTLVAGSTGVAYLFSVANMLFPDSGRPGASIPTSISRRRASSSPSSCWDACSKPAPATTPRRPSAS